MKRLFPILVWLLLLLCLWTAHAQPLLRTPWTTNNPPNGPELNNGLTINSNVTDPYILFGTQWYLGRNGFPNFRLAHIPTGLVPFNVTSNTVITSNLQSRGSVDFSGAETTVGNIVGSGGASFEALGAVSSFQLQSGAANGYVMQSDGSGIGTWVPPSAAIGGVGTLPAGYLLEDFNAYQAGARTSFPYGMGWSESGHVISGAGGVSLITNVTLAGGQTRNVLHIKRGDYVRRMPWGTNWTQIRMGLLWSAEGVATNFTNCIAWGLLNGTNAPFGAINTSLFVGNQSTFGSFQMNYSNQAPSAPFIDFGANFGGFGGKTNAAQIGISSGSGSTGPAMGASNHFTITILEITRTGSGVADLLNLPLSTNYLWRIKRPDRFTSDVVPWFRRPGLATLFADLQPLTFGANGFAVSTGNASASAQAVNAGPTGVTLNAGLDSINFSWDQPTVGVHLMAIMVFKAY